MMTLFVMRPFDSDKEMTVLELSLIHI